MSLLGPFWDINLTTVFSHSVLASGIKLREPVMPDCDAGLTTLQGARPFSVGGYDPLLAPSGVR
jgi:hypothetical protein